MSDGSDLTKTAPGDKSKPQDNTESSAHKEGAVDEFLHSAAYAALQEPVSGLAQLSDHIFGTDLLPKVQFMGAPEQEKFGTAGWHAEQIGSAVGSILPFMVVRGGVHAALGDGELGLAGMSMKEAGLTGFSYNFLMQPVAENSGNFWLSKAEGGALGAGSFMAMGGFAKGLNGVAGSLSRDAADSGILRSSVVGLLRNPISSSVLSGLPVGAANAEVSSLMTDGKAASASDVGHSMYQMGVMGGVFGAFGALEARNAAPSTDAAPAAAAAHPGSAESMASRIRSVMPDLSGVKNALTPKFPFSPASGGVEAYGAAMNMGGGHDGFATSFGDTGSSVHMGATHEAGPLHTVGNDAPHVGEHAFGADQGVVIGNHGVETVTGPETADTTRRPATEGDAAAAAAPTDVAAEPEEAKPAPISPEDIKKAMTTALKSRATEAQKSNALDLAGIDVPAGQRTAFFQGAKYLTADTPEATLKAFVEGDGKGLESQLMSAATALDASGERMLALRQAYHGAEEWVPITDSKGEIVPDQRVPIRSDLAPQYRQAAHLVQDVVADGTNNGAMRALQGILNGPDGKTIGESLDMMGVMRDDPKTYALLRELQYGANNVIDDSKPTSVNIPYEQVVPKGRNEAQAESLKSQMSDGLGALQKLQTSSAENYPESRADFIQWLNENPDLHEAMKTVGEQSRNSRTAAALDSYFGTDNLITFPPPAEATAPPEPTAEAAEKPAEPTTSPLSNPAESAEKGALAGDGTTEGPAPTEAPAPAESPAPAEAPAEGRVEAPAETPAITDPAAARVLMTANHLYDDMAPAKSANPRMWNDDPKGLARDQGAVSVETLKDGSIRATYAANASHISSVTDVPGGTRVTNYDDASPFNVVVNYPNDVDVYQMKDGSVKVDMPNGDYVIENPDGSDIKRVLQEGGFQTTLHSDGTYERTLTEPAQASPQSLLGVIGDPEADPNLKIRLADNLSGRIGEMTQPEFQQWLDFVKAPSAQNPALANMRYMNLANGAVLNRNAVSGALDGTAPDSLLNRPAFAGDTRTAAERLKNIMTVRGAGEPGGHTFPTWLGDLSKIQGGTGDDIKLPSWLIRDTRQRFATSYDDSGSLAHDSSVPSTIRDYLSTHEDAPMKDKYGKIKEFSLPGGPQDVSSRLKSLDQVLQMDAADHTEPRVNQAGNASAQLSDAAKAKLLDLSGQDGALINDILYKLQPGDARKPTNSGDYYRLLNATLPNASDAYTVRLMLDGIRNGSSRDSSADGRLSQAVALAAGRELAGTSPEAQDAVSDQISSLFKGGTKDDPNAMSGGGGKRGAPRGGDGGKDGGREGGRDGGRDGGTRSAAREPRPARSGDAADGSALTPGDPSAAPDLSSLPGGGTARGGGEGKSDAGLTEGPADTLPKTSTDTRTDEPAGFPRPVGEGEPADSAGETGERPEPGSDPDKPKMVWDPETEEYVAAAPAPAEGGADEGAAAPADDGPNFMEKWENERDGFGGPDIIEGGVPGGFEPLVSGQEEAGQSEEATNGGASPGFHPEQAEIPSASEIEAGETGDAAPQFSQSEQLVLEAMQKGNLRQSDIVSYLRNRSFSDRTRTRLSPNEVSGALRSLKKGGWIQKGDGDQSELSDQYKELQAGQ